MRIDIHSTPVRGGILCLQFEPLFQSRGFFFCFSDGTAIIGWEALREQLHDRCSCETGASCNGVDVWLSGSSRWTTTLVLHVRLRALKPVHIRDHDIRNLNRTH